MLSFRSRLEVSVLSYTFTQPQSAQHKLWTCCALLQMKVVEDGLLAAYRMR